MTSEKSDLSNSDSTTASPPEKDVALVYGKSETGDALRILRAHNDTLELGEIRKLEEGKPIHGDVVRLTKRKEHEQLYNVEVLHKQPQPESLPQEQPKSGRPALVTSNLYRKNWEAIFGTKKSDAPLN